MKLQTTSIIRDRGQLTIPEAIRKIAQWTSPLSVVTLSIKQPYEITIKPHSIQTKVDWSLIWQSIRLSRSFRGKNEMKSAQEMIAEDRESR